MSGDIARFESEPAASDPLVSDAVSTLQGNSFSSRTSHVCFVPFLLLNALLRETSKSIRSCPFSANSFTLKNVSRNERERTFEEIRPSIYRICDSYILGSIFARTCDNDVRWMDSNVYREKFENAKVRRVSRST